MRTEKKRQRRVKRILTFEEGTGSNEIKSEIAKHETGTHIRLNQFHNY